MYLLHTIAYLHYSPCLYFIHLDLYKLDLDLVLLNQSSCYTSARERIKTGGGGSSQLPDRGRKSCVPRSRNRISCVPRVRLHVYHRDKTNPPPPTPERKGKQTRSAARDTTHTHNPRSSVSTFSTTTYTWNAWHFVTYFICFGSNFNM
jgi:hypothetical protein